MTRPRADLDVSSVLLEPERFPPDAPLSWPDLFGDGRPILVEVGSGKGLFLVNAGLQRPEFGCFGIELAKKYARLAAERAVKSGVTNVRMWPADAGALLARRIPEASVREVHVYFPDPWWKKRHKKRRVFNQTLVASILRVLEPNGELHVATDVEEYHGVIRELLAGEPRFAEIDPPPLNDPEHDHDYLTNFERKYRIEGRPVYRSSYRLTATP
ncbi:tRNA (guanosine(46)-N7)-methyltransferase TrmB [Paludisphaera borealis]|uniref:tRNA (guanine-N(7)-)-methyltransferase n=1 Tax=Paludisphaera borealis TaxID=1387353 RepID=A0A1U7CLH9_9BACT|nr:tRNA (guanosine(46)-N7)-methyltransferase TrmB [Paludisphaera borealis]APW59767.1 tRNA (guanine-N(7)-)-methyltransferase [Paludisphaera borealis]MDR3623244.1 tRNA (guanosine(46)-N7)-methyltransferase TrmB [Paludisphaera borealis]